MITFAVEQWPDVKQEALPLWDHHYQEVGEGRAAGWALNVDHKMFDLFHARGALKIVTARDRGRLIGYHASIVEPLLHYAHVLADKCDVYWLEPEYRQGRTGVKLFEAAEAAARQRGCLALYSACKLGEHDYTKLFEYLGYELTEKRFRKVL